MFKGKIAAFVGMSMLCLVANRVQAQEIRHENIACPLGPTTTGYCEAGCRENAMGGGNCPQSCTISKPSMYTVDGNPEVKVFTEQRGNHKTIELPAGTDASITEYYASQYSAAIAAAVGRGDREYAGKLEAEQNMTRLSLDRYRSNVSVVQLHVSASRFFRTSWTKMGWFSGWITAGVSVRYRCTSAPTPVLDEALKKSQIKMAVDTSDKKSVEAAAQVPTQAPAVQAAPAQ